MLLQVHCVELSSYCFSFFPFYLSAVSLFLIRHIMHALDAKCHTQLKNPSHPGLGIPVAVNCLAALLKEPLVRSSFVQAEGVKLLTPLISPASTQQSIQVNLSYSGLRNCWFLNTGVGLFLVLAVADSLTFGNFPSFSWNLLVLELINEVLELQFYWAHIIWTRKFCNWQFICCYSFFMKHVSVFGCYLTMSRQLSTWQLLELCHD